MNSKEESCRVLVTLLGGSKNEMGENEEPIRLMTTGELKKTPNGCILRYQESQTDDSDGTVMTQDIVLMMQPGRVSMNRLGDFGTSMVFVKDRRFEGVYRTPYGDMDMALFATRVDVNLGEDRGNVYLEYQLDFAGGFASMHTMQLEYVASDKPC